MRNILVILDNDIINVMMEMNKVVEAPRHRPELMGYTFSKLQKWAYSHNGNVYEQPPLPMASNPCLEINLEDYHKENPNELHR